MATNANLVLLAGPSDSARVPTVPRDAIEPFDQERARARMTAGSAQSRRQDGPIKASCARSDLGVLAGDRPVPAVGLDSESSKLGFEHRITDEGDPQQTRHAHKALLILFCSYE